ncbi:MAG TPA: T9SS type A sorting domain-containing protein [Ignavibacteria bacterium]|nr:T9SS type A sorting domain-containing protein [Ignavibacteria bacterium]
MKNFNIIFFLVFIFAVLFINESVLAQLPTFSCGTTSYSSITGSAGPTGDDETITVNMPFSFTYIGSSYSQVSICSNGWIAMGSTSSNSYEHNLCTTEPIDLRKIAPYWNDLDPSSGGTISYTTLGSSPNRTFVVQYASVRYYQSSSTVTFQVRLYETTNIIEFIYGTGTALTSAEIGLIDATGGSNHHVSVYGSGSCSSIYSSTTSCYNISWSFSSGLKFTFSQISPPPQPPVLVYPSNNSTGLPLTPALDWTDVSGATTYGVQVSTSAGFGSTVVNQSGLSSSTYTIGSGVLNNGTQYFWRANATGSSGTSGWSSVFNFTTAVIPPPNPPTLLSPPNNATGVSSTPLLDWSDVSGANTYAVQVSTNSGFSSFVVNLSGLGSSQYTVTPALNGGSQYFWRANATGSTGTSAWSTVFSFTTSVPVSYQRVEFYENVSPSGENLGNLIDPGAKVRFKVNIRNDMLEGLVTAFGNITTSSQNVTITDNQGTFNNILSGQGGWTVDEFEIAIGSNFQPGTRINITLTVQQQTPPYGPWSSTFSFPVAPMKVSSHLVDDDANPDSYGNNNDICEPNEKIEIIPMVQNISQDIMYTNKAQLTSPITWLNIWNGVQGVSGMVYDTWRLNVSGGNSQPINPGANNILPEQDYVFAYNAPSAYNLPMYDVFTSYYNGPAGGNWWEGGIKIKYSGGFRINPNSPNPIGIQKIGTEIPLTFKLYTNYPNPFNPETRIIFDIPKKSDVKITVYDIMGKEVGVIVNENLEPGKYGTVWSGTEYASGLYIYTISARDYFESKKMLLVK